MPYENGYWIKISRIKSLKQVNWNKVIEKRYLKEGLWNKVIEKGHETSKMKQENRKNRNETEALEQ